MEAEREAKSQVEQIITSEKEDIVIPETQDAEPESNGITVHFYFIYLSNAIPEEQKHRMVLVQNLMQTFFLTNCMIFHEAMRARIAI